MNTNEMQNMKSDEAGFLTALVVIELIILPMLGDRLGKYGGGIAMFVGAALGLVAYLLLFGQRLRNRGQTKLFFLIVGLSAFIGAALALGLSLWRN